jgi:hypothetical protein
MAAGRERGDEDRDQAVRRGRGLCGHGFQAVGSRRPCPELRVWLWWWLASRLMRWPSRGGMPPPHVAGVLDLRARMFTRCEHRASAGVYRSERTLPMRKRFIGRLSRRGGPAGLLLGLVAL